MKLAERIGMAILAAALALATGAAQANCAVVAGYPVTTPDGDFADAGNGTVRHIPTGLIWKRCAEGQTWNGATCTGSAAGYTWQQVFERADAVNAGTQGENAGQTDWRVPNINELKSITELGCTNPSINTTQFPAAPASDFWSGSPYAGYSGYAWGVGFYVGYGYWNDRDYALRVRLVRAGQSFYNFDAAADVTAPVLTGVGVSDTSQTATSLAGISDEAATGYWIAVARDAAAPTAEQVKAGANYGAVTVVASGSGAMAAATAATFAVSGLTAATDYDLYLVAQDGSVSANFSALSGPVPFTTLANTYAITASANPVVGGTATCTVNPVTSGGSSTCTYTVNPGYSFVEWSGDCAGASCELSNVTTAKSVTATFAPVTSYTGPTPTAGDATISVSGAGCVLTGTPQFIVAPVGAPANTSFPYGLADFTVAGCVGGTATVTVTYPSAIPAGARYWKEEGGVYTEYLATLGANSVTFTLTDGGPGDSDGAADGSISDPSGVGVTAAAQTQSIPVLGPWGLAVLSGLLGLFGVWGRRRRA